MKGSAEGLGRATRYSSVSGNSVAGDARISTCRPASRSAATPIRQCLLIGGEPLFRAGSALRLIRPTSDSAYFEFPDTLRFSPLAARHSPMADWWFKTLLKKWI